MVLCSSDLLLLLLLKLLLMAELQLGLLALFCLAEFDQLALEGFSDLYLGEWLLMRTHLYTLHVVYHCLSESASTGWGPF